MSSEWKEVSLNEVGQIVTGKTPPSTIDNAYADDGIPFITPKDMTGARFVSRAERHLSKVGLTAVKNNIVPADSVAVSCIGSDMGKSVLLKSESVTNQQINTIIVDQTKFDPKFIYYVLSTKQQDFKNLASGSATPILNKGHFGKVVINTPKIANQKAISSILDPIDSKIELNRQTNQTLEQIAQALFKSWFVDFEPTRAKIAAKEAGASPEEIERAAMCAISGKTPEQLAQLLPETQQNLKTTAALFPDSLVDSELGEIPAGWEVKSLSEIAQYANGKVEVSKLNVNNYISTENMLENRGGVTAATSLPSVSSVPSFSPNHILVSNIRPYFKKIWFARFDGGRSSDVLGFSAKEKGCEEFLYNLLYQDEFFGFMMRTSKGAKMPRGDKDAIANWKFVCASKALRKEFSERVSPSYKFIETLNSENISLSYAREILLPKLLSGEIPINESLTDLQGAA